MTFGMVLQGLRKERHLTQEELAKAIGVSRSTVGMYEQGKREPDFETEEKIADFFNVTLNYLRGGKSSSSSEGQTGWYLDPETARAAQEVFDNPETRMLFDAARDARPEDIRLAAEMLRRFKETNPDG